MIHQAKLMDNMYHAQLAGTQAPPQSQTGLNGLGANGALLQRPTASPASPPIKCDSQIMSSGQSGSASPSGAIANMERDKDRATYLQQLIKDQKCCLSYPNVFHHVERLLSEEIVKVRSVLFQNNNRPLELPSPAGKTVTLSKKVFVPAKDFPDYNFVGRILGPRGLTAKQLEQETGCKIMVRGKGSMRDKKKEEQNRGRPNWEHLNEELHVLITVEDSENRAEIKLQRAVAEIDKLLIPAIEGEDDLKKKQLMELAIINGTYRDNSNGKPQNGLSPTQRIAVPTNLTTLASPAGMSRFSLPTMPTMQTMMAPNVLRPGGMMNQAGLAQPMDAVNQIYYTAVPSQLDGSQYPYAITPGLMNGMEAYVSQNVSPHEGSTGTSPGSSNSTNQFGGLKVNASRAQPGPTARQQSHPYARPQQGGL